MYRNKVTAGQFECRECEQDSQRQANQAMSSLIVSYDRAGWHHLVNANVSPADSASPQKPLTDMWLHFRGTDIDGCTVVIRAIKQMNVIEVSGLFRPLDLVKLSGHFGIPKVDPGAVMVPAPPGH